MLSFSAHRAAAAVRRLSTTNPSPSAILAQLGIKSECRSSPPATFGTHAAVLALCSGGYTAHAYSHTCCSGVFDGKSWSANGEWADAVAPATGEVMARVRMGSVQDLQRCTQAALDARADWAAIPAPRRGEIVRQIGNKFREVRSGCPPALRTRLSSRLQLKF